MPGEQELGQKLKLRKTDLKIMKELSGRVLTIRSLFLAVKIDEHDLYKHLKNLRELGFVERVGRGKYTLTPDGEALARMFLQRGLKFADRFYLPGSPTPRKNKNNEYLNKNDNR